MRRFILLLTVAHSLFAAEYVDRSIAATFKLYNEASTSTGLVVDAGTADAPELVLISAAHSFAKMQGDHFLLVLRKQQKNGSYKRRDVKVLIRRNGDLWQKAPGADVAALRLDLKPEDAALITPLPLSAIADAEAIAQGVLGSGDDVRMLCYPHRFESHGAGFPVVRQGVVSSHPIAPVKPHPTFLLDVTTFAGDSGGPVIIPSPDDSKAPLVVGIVRGQHFNDERVELSRHETRIIKHPLGVAIISQADFAREAIRRLRSPDSE
jgi:hypothetical protein